MGLDLNLLVSLDALLHERSVTRAAQRLGLSQPTLSTALARLRRHFDDELLARTGNAYELTALGERLAENTTQALMWSAPGGGAPRGGGGPPPRGAGSGKRILATLSSTFSS
ncbi:LysR family transcriptional regulator, partial [Saccharopolyspora sp. 6T]|nr:LysR family transcriptional regulator [Saccharopolyspora sp. 6T]